MKSKVVFAGQARLIVRWSGTTMPKLERELGELLAKYGLQLTDSGHDSETQERVLNFGPRK